MLIEVKQTTIKDLQIQPIKGGSSLTLTSALMTPAGLETLPVDGKVIQDHFLFVATKDVDHLGYHNGFTQRVRVDPEAGLFVPGSPQLALIKPENRDGTLVFHFGSDEVIAPDMRDDYPTNVIPVQLWEYRGQGIEVPILSEFVSDELKRRVIVVRTSGPWDRMSRQNFERNDNPLRAQDGYPLHPVVWEDVVPSFTAINETPDAKRFRYQVLLEGLGFRQIHDYASGEINGVPVRQPKPCGRCEVTGIDQDKGVFSRIKPLAGLSKIAGRWIRNETKRDQVMGENWLPKGKTVISVGDIFTFLELRDPQLKFENPKKG